MLNIITPSREHAATLTALAVTTFFESHGESGPREELEDYVARRLTLEQLTLELSQPELLYRMAFSSDVAAGFSSIMPNQSHPSVAAPNMCKMDRLYIAKEFYDRKVGRMLFDLNVEIAKSMDQLGMWLYVWQGNERALRFYRRQGFDIVDETTFRISDRHSNPNYIMMLYF